MANICISDDDDDDDDDDVPQMFLKLTFKEVYSEPCQTYTLDLIAKLGAFCINI